MTILREWIRRLWGTLRRNPRDRDLAQELEVIWSWPKRTPGATADQPTLRRERPGCGREARLRAGGAAQAMEALRDQRGLPWLEDLVRDVRSRLARGALESTRPSRLKVGSWPP